MKREREMRGGREGGILHEGEYDIVGYSKQYVSTCMRTYTCICVFMMQPLSSAISPQYHG